VEKMTQEISQNQASFESIRRSENGVEYWSARELMPLLEYFKWQKFENAIERAKESVTTTGQKADDHFTGAGKMVLTGSGAEREVIDYHLTRYACYLIAQNGDPRKKAIALAQTYFAVQTRRQEMTQIEAAERKRLEARQKLSDTERKFSGVLHERGVDSKGIAEIRSSGDQQLFGGKSTKEMKSQYDIKPARPLADFMPTVLLKAKDLAAEMTSVNSIEKDLSGKPKIKIEHDHNNRSVRGALLERGIRPESLPPEEDAKKVARRLREPLKEINNGF
jgi:DNA-damage-inducible protein D